MTEPEGAALLAPDDDTCRVFREGQNGDACVTCGVNYPIHFHPAAAERIAVVFAADAENGCAARAPGDPPHFYCCLLPGHDGPHMDYFEWPNEAGEQRG